MTEEEDEVDSSLEEDSEEEMGELDSKAEEEDALEEESGNFSVRGASLEFSLVEEAFLVQLAIDNANRGKMSKLIFFIYHSPI